MSVDTGPVEQFLVERPSRPATGAVLERTYKSGEKLEPADVEERQLQYIYPDGQDFVFMDAAVRRADPRPGRQDRRRRPWLSDGMNVDVTIFNGLPIGISLPSHVVLQITACEPGVKGDTASGATKPATLSTGADRQRAALRAGRASGSRSTRPTASTSSASTGAEPRTRDHFSAPSGHIALS